MITVDKVKEKLQNEGADTLANNEQLLKTGSVKKQNNNSVFYWLLGIGALGIGAYLVFHKKGGTASGENTGISG